MIYLKIILNSFKNEATSGTRNWQRECISCHPHHTASFPFIRPSIHASIHPSVHPSMLRFIRPSIHASIHPSVHPCIDSFVHPSVRPSIHASIHPSVHLSIHSSFRACMHLYWWILPFNNKRIYFVITFVRQFLKMSNKCNSTSTTSWTITNSNSDFPTAVKCF